MKKVWVLVLILLLNIVVHGQGPVNIGIKFGMNNSTMVTDIDQVLNQNVQSQDTINYFGGIFVRVNFGRLYLQPEIYFNTKGGTISLAESNLTSSTFDYQTIDVPLLLGIKLINRDLINIRINGGPVFSYITGNDLVSDFSDLSAEDLDNRYVGWQVGVGFDIWFLTLDARIENSSNILSSSSTYEARNKVFLLSAGIKLF